MSVHTVIFGDEVPTSVMETSDSWSGWSVQIVQNKADPFWGPLTLFTDLGIFVFGFGGPRLVLTRPVRS